MANGSGEGSNAFLAFVVGGLLVMVAVLGFFMVTGHRFAPHGTPTASLDVNVHNR